MKKLGCILLIDDDEATNFLHKMLIDKANCAERVETARNGLEALDFLRTRKQDNIPSPEIIFVDINMPRMNGWEFLDHYQQLDAEEKSSDVIVMLTTSRYPDDRRRAEANNVVTAFANKPLTVERIEQIVRENFVREV